MHIVNGAGHCPHQQQPSYCNKIIYRFIEGKCIECIFLNRLIIKRFLLEFDDKENEQEALDSEVNNNNGL